MLEAHDVAAGGAPDEVLELPFEHRQRSRSKAVLRGGESVGIFLPRGTILRDGMLLRASDGRLLLVRAADEEVSTVSSDDPMLLARVAYHLGNRHVRLQVGDGFLRFQHDRVLDALVRALGGEVQSHLAPFEPEAGAYARASGQHDHG
jgi:urease accessory protein